MKILMVNKFLYPNGGSETYIFKLGEELTKRGHEVSYFGMDHPKRIVGNRTESYTQNMDFHTGKLGKLLYPFKIIYSTEARKKIGEVLDDFAPDAVHLNNFNFQLTPSIIYEIRKYEKKQGKKIPILYTAHDYQWVCPNHMMKIPSTNELCNRCVNGKFSNCTKYNCIHNSKVKSLLGSVEASLYRMLRTYEKVDTIICPSRFLKKQIDCYRNLSDKTVAMHNFTFAEGMQGQEKENYIVYFGRYSKEKGIETLLEVCKELPEIPFVFAGGGPLEEEVNTVSNINNKGFLHGEELQKTIAKAKFSVFTSEWYENCPFSVMESQMYGTPIVASDIGGVPELLDDGKTGILYESGNKEALKKAILEMWNDSDRCEQYRKNCLEKKFTTISEYCDKLEELYSVR